MMPGAAPVEGYTMAGDPKFIELRKHMNAVESIYNSKPSPQLELLLKTLRDPTTTHVAKVNAASAPR